MGRLSAQILLTIVDSIVNKIERHVWRSYGSTSMSFDHRSFAYICKRIQISASQIRVSNTSQQTTTKVTK